MCVGGGFPAFAHVWIMFACRLYICRSSATCRGAISAASLLRCDFTYLGSLLQCLISIPEYQTSAQNPMSHLQGVTSRVCYPFDSCSLASTEMPALATQLSPASPMKRASCSAMLIPPWRMPMLALYLEELSCLALMPSSADFTIKGRS